jgi:CHAT domain-containing protein
MKKVAEPIKTRQDQTAQELFISLLAHGNSQAQRHFLDAHYIEMDMNELASQLKAQSDQWLRSDIQRCLEICALLHHLAELSGNPHHEALGLLAEANARGLGLGEYEQAIQLYDQAADIYRENGDERAQASSQAGKIGALRFLGRYDEALEAGNWATQVLAREQAWSALARVVANLAIIYYQLGDDEQALAAFERAQRLYQQAGQADSPGWLRAEFNRAIVLRNLGKFDASIQSSKLAFEKLNLLKQPVEAARAHQNLALTYFVLGRYNEALEILDQVQAVFLDDNRQRDAILTELFISDCLLQLRRYPDVLGKCKQVRQAFNQLGTRFEVGLAVLDEAVAYAGMKRLDEALVSLQEARRIFVEQGTPSWVEMVDLEIAALYLRKGQFEAGYQAALACTRLFENQPVKRAQANLIAAKARLASGCPDEVEALVKQALQGEEVNNLPALTYVAHAVLGKLAEEKGEYRQALDEYEFAIQSLEILRGRMMVEFRADFLEDKQSLYEDVVSLYIDLGYPQQALQHAERAKSRALLELIAYRLDLGLAVLDSDDKVLAAELVRLRAERDRLYRRWESDMVKEEMRLRGGQVFEEGVHQAQAEVISIEKRITGIWHKLLIHNAAYARDASLWQVRVEPVQPYLQADTLLLEYFFTHDQVCLFLVGHDSLQALRLQAGKAEIQRLLQRLWLNWKAATTQPVSEAAKLKPNADGVLGQLERLLLAPVGEHLAAYHKLVIVPHGILHYLPFHALFDGQDYLIANHEISYLPAASFLRYSQETQREGSGFLVAGNSYGGRLPFTTEEAGTVARLWNAKPLIEEQATLARLQQEAPGRRGLHLATHGSFRADNPLFSGLALADGWLTTLDIFNLRLQASLVTLSACETGRSLVAGGDELLGLMRAFLYAGAASLVLSQWVVDDRSTARLMERFYTHLANGLSKGAALRQAQLSFLAEQPPASGGPAAYSHPYYWAPFFLVGDNGAF